MRKYINLFLSCLIVFAISICNSSICYAHQSAKEHDDEFMEVFFENGYSKYQPKIKDYINALEIATQLTIDQYQGNNEKDYDVLKAMKFTGLPQSFEKIDYSYDIVSGTKKITPNTHRMYTHEGWDKEYDNKKVKNFWNNRRKVLLSTVNGVFGFNSLALLGQYNKKCNAMAGLIYYVHLLGDYDEADNYKKISRLIPLAGRDNKSGYINMTGEVKKYVEILFEDQQSTPEYKTIMNGLDQISKDAGRLVDSTGSVNTDEKFVEYKQYADELFDLLKENMPTLCKKEKFFKDIFYPN